MNIDKQDMVDGISSQLRKAMAITDLMACSDNIPLNEGTIQELGIQLTDKLKSAISDLEKLGKNL